MINLRPFNYRLAPVWNRWQLLGLTSISWLVFFGLPAFFLEVTGFDTKQFYGSDAVLSAFALIAVIFGYWMFIRHQCKPNKPSLGSNAFPGLLKLSESFILVTAPIALALSVRDAWGVINLGYLDSNPISPELNYLGYIQISLIPIFLWNRDRMSKRRYWCFLIAICLPRLIISLFGPRFFLLQAAIPIFLWETIYYRVINARYLFAWLIVSGFFLFYFAPMIRGDGQLGVQSMVAGSPLGFRRIAQEYDLAGDNAREGIILCEIIANSTGFDACGLRESWSIDDSVRPRIDQAATSYLRSQVSFPGIGTGGNPIVEAFPRGKLTFTGLGWFFLIGVSLGLVVSTARNYPLACFMFPHVTAKCAFLWRGTISEYFDRMPLIFLSFLILMLLYKALRKQHNDLRVST